jgi:DNA-binding winged helix-turn-helix (wHTH) protein
MAEGLYQFKGYLLDIGRRALFFNGEPVKINAKAFDLLVYLIKNSERVISKEELIDKVWDNRFVEEANLKVQISTLRKIFGERADAANFIVTVPGKGYKFIAQFTIKDKNVNGNDTASDFDTVIHQQSNGYNYDLSPRADPKNLNGKHRASATSDNKNVNQNTINKTNKFYRLSLSFAIIFLVSIFFVIGIKLYNNYINQAFQPSIKEVNRLTWNGKILVSTVSNDGKFIVYSQKEDVGESLWLRQLSTGVSRQISESRSIEYLALTVSPDNEYIYAPVFQNNQADTPLLKIPLIGGPETVIADVVTGAAVDFSPDGKKMVFAVSNQPFTRLIISNSDGSNQEIIKTAVSGKNAFAFWKCKPAAWSPDGKLIAYLMYEKGENGLKASIYLYDLETDTEKKLVSRYWSTAEEIVWLDSETLVLLATNEEEYAGSIWQVSLNNQTPILLTKDSNKYKGISNHGRIVVTNKLSTTSSINSLKFDRDKIYENKELYSESGYITSIALDKSKNIYFTSTTSGKREVWKLSDQKTSQLTVGADAVFGISFSPYDGKLYFGSKSEGISQIYSLIENNNRPEKSLDADNSGFPNAAPDGRIVYQKGVEYEKPEIWILNLPTGENKRLIERGTKPVFSPDGKLIAYFSMIGEEWKIGISDSNTGALINSVSLPKFINDRRMRWHPSGKFLTAVYNKGNKLYLGIIPLNGQPFYEMEIGSGDILSFEWSADGTELIYSSEKTTTDTVMFAL